MKSLGLLFCILLLGLEGFSQTENPAQNLTGVDQQIFAETVAKCRSGTVGSALNLAFDLKNLSSGLSNWLGFLSGNGEAARERLRNHGLAARLYTLKHSPGFWLALSQCYGYRYGELNYGLLIKQIIDAGQLTSEVASAGTALAVTVTGAKYQYELWSKFPLAGRFVAAGFFSLSLYRIWSMVHPLLFDLRSESERAEARKTEARIFAEPDQAIQEVYQRGLAKIKEIDSKLKSDGLTSDEVRTLQEKRANITSALNEMNSLKN